jgi:hypothetical protein
LGCGTACNTLGGATPVSVKFATGMLASLVFSDNVPICTCGEPSGGVNRIVATVEAPGATEAPGGMIRLKAGEPEMLGAAGLRVSGALPTFEIVMFMSSALNGEPNASVDGGSATNLVPVMAVSGKCATPTLLSLLHTPNTAVC